MDADQLILFLLLVTAVCLGVAVVGSRVFETFYILFGAF